MNGAKRDDARKWMWTFLAVVVALQLYFVRELIAAFFIFALGFAVFGSLTLAIYLAEQARRASFAWAEPGARVLFGFARRGAALVEELSRRPFRRPRSEPAR